MKAYYDLCEILKTAAAADIDCNTVTKGDPTLMALDKTTVYPLVHYEIRNFQIGASGSCIWGVEMYAMNQRVEKQETVSDKYVGNHNEDDNLNAMAYVIVRVVKNLMGQQDDFSITNISRAEVFTLKGADVVDGWRITFDVTMGLGDYTAC